VRDFAECRATDDCAVPRALLGAWAVLLGKTNVALMFADWQSNNPIYRRTVIPWDERLTPGGSTGGGLVSEEVKSCCSTTSECLGTEPG
jgi:amidase